MAIQGNIQVNTLWFSSAIGHSFMASELNIKLPTLCFSQASFFLFIEMNTSYNEEDKNEDDEDKDDVAPGRPSDGSVSQAHVLGIM